MLNTLSYIGEKLNSSDVLWGVGGSILLKQFGLTDKTNDIDLFVDIQDVEKVDGILKAIGTKKPYKNDSILSSEFFNVYTVDHIDVDIIAGFAINHDSGVFQYTFDHKSISNIKTINRVEIPFTSLEDWYVLYQIIPNREAKVKLIESYLLSNGMENPYLLQRILEESLPKKIKERANKVLYS